MLQLYDFLVPVSLLVLYVVILGSSVFVQLLCTFYFSLVLAEFLAKGVTNLYLGVCIRIYAEIFEQIMFHSNFILAM